MEFSFAQRRKECVAPSFEWHAKRRTLDIKERQALIVPVETRHRPEVVRNRVVLLPRLFFRTEKLKEENYGFVENRSEFVVLKMMFFIHVFRDALLSCPPI